MSLRLCPWCSSAFLLNTWATYTDGTLVKSQNNVLISSQWRSVSGGKQDSGTGGLAVGTGTRGTALELAQ